MKRVHFLAVVFTVVGLLASNLIGPGTSGVHADPLTPVVSSLEITSNPVNVDALGTNFPSGAAVRIDLMVGTVSGVVPFTLTGVYPAQVVASVVTSASLTRNIIIGNGTSIRIVHIVGGTFDVNIANPLSTCGNGNYWLVATVVSSGLSYTSQISPIWAVSPGQCYYGHMYP